MKILVLILMIYSIFGIHLTWTLGELGNGRKVTFSTNTICIFIAIILYCIKFLQTLGVYRAGPRATCTKDQS